MPEPTPALPNATFLGTGWSFPPQFRMDVVGGVPQGSVVMTSDVEDIQASLRILFGTALGERFLQPRYGLNMQEMLFESVSTTTLTLLKDRIRTAILIYEPRINPLGLELDTSGLLEGRITLLLEYAVKATNSRYNLVYPFYLTDASEVRSLRAAIPA